jgi:hypothetical protein
MQCDKHKDHAGGFFALIFWFVMTVLATRVDAGEANEISFLEQFAPLEINGFLELRAGHRTREDPYEKDISVLEARLQAELFTCTDWAEFKYKGDVWADGVTEKGEYDTREAWIFARPSDFLDLKVGRQVLTWGTGELVFLNDLFPKDWQSFFVGRDAEYLKGPSDAAKCSFFTELANFDVVYTPQFDPDRYVTGEYVSYWNEALGRPAGGDAMVSADKPDRWWRDDEIAVRIYKNIDNYEYALYGYWGFWKTPAGQAASGAATFPALNVYGASARGQVGPGIGNIELAYYQSTDDESGRDPAVRNSEMRYLLGYAQEIGRDFSASLQYYVEQILDYSRYKESLISSHAKDRCRHVITLQLTKLLMSQNLELSLSAYLSPTDKDAYLRPLVDYKYTDHLALIAGSNIFIGDCRRTFFAQFKNNSNIYLAVRYSF